MRISVFINLCVLLIAIGIFANVRALLNETKDYTSRLLKIEAALSLISDQRGDFLARIKERAIRIAKAEANALAFSGTDCARCHIDPKLNLPLDTNKHFLTMEEYTAIVRSGIPDVMPGYDEESVSAAELFKQYKLMRGLVENELQDGFTLRH